MIRRIVQGFLSFFQALTYHIKAAISRFFWLLFGGTILAVFTLAGFIYYFSKDLPTVERLFLAYRRPYIRLFDCQGKQLATYGDAYGDVVQSKELPLHVIQALLAVEDKRFYSHFGIDVWGLLRAFWANYHSGRIVQGGSTITQQLAKNLLQAHHLYGSQDRSLRRKIQEALLAFLLEAKLKKEQILTLYLNRVYFGSGAFGIDAAALRYFGKSARYLSLYEAAMLMGLLKAPSRYSPAQNPARSESRARQVLQKMVNAGFLEEDVMQAMQVLSAPATELKNASSCRYFTDWVMDQIKQVVSLDQDLDVITTLDLELQDLGEKKMAAVMEKHGRRWQADQMALLSMTPDGAVRVMVGGLSYAISKFNRTTQAMRQSGSLFKFFTYLTALEQGMTPDDFIDDTPVSVEGWSPKNYLYESQGEATVREGFAKSINAIAVRVAHGVGVNAIKQTVRRLGITTPVPHNLSISLGSSSITLLEVTAAFAVILNQGFYVAPYGIQEIKNKKGYVLYQKNAEKKQVVEPGVTRMMMDLMTAVVRQGTGHRARMAQPTACKTGTSQNYRDLWFVGFSPQMITGVWTGHDADKPLKRVSGGSPSAHLWSSFMRSALKDKPVQEFVLPEEPEPDPSVQAQEEEEGGVEKTLQDPEKLPRYKTDRGWVRPGDPGYEDVARASQQSRKNEIQEQPTLEDLVSQVGGDA